MTHPNDILEQLGVKPSKRLGQNFLLQKNLAEKMIQLSEINPSDTVLEIGPGLGILTEILCEKGIHVTAIEKDRKLAHYLTEKFSKSSNIKIVENDFLDFNLSEGSWHVIGNIPYSITSDVIKKVIDFKSNIRQATLMVPQDIYFRLKATQGKEYGYLSLLCQLHFNIFGLFTVSPSNFYPQPKIVSQVMSLKPKENVLNKKQDEKFREIISQCFQKRRKMLKAIFPSFKDWQAVSLNPQFRPEQVTLTQYISWVRYLVP